MNLFSGADGALFNDDNDLFLRIMGFYFCIWAQTLRPSMKNAEGWMELRDVASTLDFDYVIIGAGTAGCLLANRLSQNPDNKVLVLEAVVKINISVQKSLSAISSPWVIPKLTGVTRPKKKKV